MIDSHLNLMGIYIILNRRNGKLYVGSSCCVRLRWRYHKSNLRRGVHCCTHLQNAWAKYGSRAFIVMVVEEVEDENHLLQKEQFYLDNLTEYLYNSNLTAGGPSNRLLLRDSHLGIKPSEAAKKKRSESMKGAWTPERRIQASLQTKERWSNPEYKKRVSKKLSEKLKEFYSSPAGDLLRKTLRTPKTQESRVNMSRAQKLAWKNRRITGYRTTKGRKASPTERERLRTLRLGAKDSLETRKKKSLASLGKPKTLEHNMKVSRALKGRVVTWGDKISASKRRANQLRLENI